MGYDKKEKRAAGGISSRQPFFMCIVLFFEKTGIYIRHHWFDPWNGLKEVKCSVEYNHNNNKIIDFSSEEIVLIKYWCGIMF